MLIEAGNPAISTTPMKIKVSDIATAPQSETLNRLLGEGFRLSSIREYPTRLKRKPIEYVLELQKVTITPRTVSVCLALVNNKGGIE